MLKRSLLSAVLFVLLFAFTAQAQAPTSGEVNARANLRGGPGTTYSIVGALAVGTTVQITGCNEDCTWYQVGEDQWIAAFLVTPATASLTPITSVAPEPITLISWNVESGGALQAAVADRLASFENVDIFGLSEVSAIDAEAFEFGAEEGEGVDYDSLLGTTGRADRLLLIWDASRFEQVDSGELLTIGETGRAPLWVQLRDRETLEEMIVMVNHLHRSNEGIRHRQGTALNAWAAGQTLPVVAMGDYNFDWNLPNGDTDHDAGYDNLTKDGVWEWVRPAELVTTQCSGWPCGYNSVLDFVFVAGPAQEWNVTSEIIVVENDFPDDFTTPDHRPVLAVIMPDGAEAAPVPTLVPVPASNGFTAEEQTYIDFMADLSTMYADALVLLSNEFTAAGEDPSVIMSDSWTTNVATAMSTIKSLNQQIRKTDAPSRFALVDIEMNTVASQYDQAIDLLFEGISNLDVNKFVEAQPFMLEGANALTRASTALTRATASSPAPTATLVTPPTAVPVQPQPTAVPPTAVPPTTVPPTAVPPVQNCDPNYAGACIPQVSYDLDCGEISDRRFQSIGSDPHGFDGDDDGIACES
jgi:endonuclease/exonuclease/phosphatase family metal-dependent hydrolase